MNAIRNSLLVLTVLAGCASAGPSASATAPTAAALPGHASLAGGPLTCADLEVVQPEDIASVEPLWVPTPAVKSPAYSLGGVIIELHEGHGLTRERLQQAIDCRSACAAPIPAAGLLAAADVHASVVADQQRLTMILRADDPLAARRVLRRAEQLQQGAAR